MKHTLYSKTIIKNDLKLFGFIGILYTLLLGFLLPFSVLTDISHDYQQNIVSSNYFLVADVFWMLALTIPVIITILLFRYVQNTRSLSKLHALPYTRVQLFNSHLISGSIIVSLPVIINIFFLLTGVLLHGYQEYVSAKEIIVFCCLYILVELVMFLITAMIGMMIGSSIMTGIISFVLIFLPIGMYTTIDFLLEHLIFGYVSNRYSDFFVNISPVVSSSGFTETNFPMISVISCIIYCAVFYIAAIKLYKLRPLERNNELICFNWVKYIFIYGVTFCTMAVTGAFLGNSHDFSFITFTIGSIIGGLIGYTIATGIAYKTFGIHRHAKGLLAYSCVILIAFALIKIDVFGYVSRVPDLNQIEYVIFDETGGYSYFDARHYSPDYKALYYELESPYNTPYAYTYEGPENIANIMDLHLNLLHNRKALTKENTRKVTISYKLKNGKSITRKYIINMNLLHDDIKPIYESDEYALKNNRIFSLKDEDLLIATLSNSVTDSGNEIIESKENKLELMKCIKEDIQNLTYEEHLKPNGRFRLSLTYQVDVPTTIEKTVTAKGIETVNVSETQKELLYQNIVIKPSFTKTINFLKSIDLYDKLLIQAEDIDSVILFNYNPNYDLNDWDQMNSDPELKRITDKDDIQLLLNNLNYEAYFRYYSEHRTAKNGASAYLFFNNGEHTYGYLNPSDKVAKIESYIN